MLSLSDFTVKVRRKNSETEIVHLGMSVRMLPDFTTNHNIYFQDRSWRDLLTPSSLSGMRAALPPGLSLISRDSDILREL